MQGTLSLRLGLAMLAAVCKTRCGQLGLGTGVRV